MKTLLTTILLLISTSVLAYIPEYKPTSMITVTTGNQASFKTPRGEFTATLSGCTKNQLSALRGSVTVTSQSRGLSQDRVIIFTDSESRRVVCHIEEISKSS